MSSKFPISQNLSATTALAAAGGQSSGASTENYSQGGGVSSAITQATTNIKSSGSASIANYRQSTQKDSYHLSLLNKENKALQNLLAAVELNRTTALNGCTNPSPSGNQKGVEHPVSAATYVQQHITQQHQQAKTSQTGAGVGGLRSAAGGSAKPHHQLLHMQHHHHHPPPQVLRGGAGVPSTGGANSSEAQQHYQSHREFGRDLSNNNNAQQPPVLNGQSQIGNVVHPILSTKAAAASTSGQSQANSSAGPSSSNNISIFKNFISQYSSSTNGLNPQLSTKNGSSVVHQSGKMLETSSNNNSSNQVVSKLNHSHQQRNTAYHHLPHNYHNENAAPSSTGEGAMARAQTSQAIKTFDASATTTNTAAHAATATNGQGAVAQRNTSSSSYHHQKAFMSSLEPMRRKTHAAPSQGVNARRLGAGELVKIGQKLTSETMMSSGSNNGKTQSFISSGNVNEEEKLTLPTPSAPGQSNSLNSGGNAQSSASLHPHQTPVSSVLMNVVGKQPQTTTNGQTQPVLLSRANVASAGHQMILPKPAGFMNGSAANQNHLGGYTSSRPQQLSGSTTLGAGTISSIVQSKLQQSSKQNLNNKHMQIVVEDKENRRDMVNRQSAASNALSLAQQPPMPAIPSGNPPSSLGSNSNQSSSTTSLLKRSKTSDPSRAPLRQKERQQQQAQDKIVSQLQQQESSANSSAQTQQSINSVYLPSLAATSTTMAASIVNAAEKEQMQAILPQIQPSMIQPEQVQHLGQTPSSSSEDASDKKPGFSKLKAEEVAKLMEERRRERMKTLTRNLEVCDLLDIRNPQSVAEFAPQIYKFLLQEEMNHLYPQDFLVGNQSEITEKMRAYLIDWLSELHQKFKLWPETLYVCVGLIDKYVMLQKDIKKKDLQCLGITALHIAGKYEEIYPPELKQILRVTDNAVQKEQVLQLEFEILQTLDFNLTFPSILRFMERFARIAQVQERIQMLAQYLCDTCLLDCTLMKERPSKLAAVCLYAAMRLGKGLANTQPIWNATLSKNSGYKEEDVRGMAMDLIKFVKNVEQSSLQSLYKKYQSPRFLEAAKLLQQ